MKKTGKQMLHSAWQSKKKHKVSMREIGSALGGSIGGDIGKYVGKPITGAIKGAGRGIGQAYSAIKSQKPRNPIQKLGDTMGKPLRPNIKYKKKHKGNPTLPQENETQKMGYKHHKIMCKKGHTHTKKCR